MLVCQPHTSISIWRIPRSTPAANATITTHIHTRTTFVRQRTASLLSWLHCQVVLKHRNQREQCICQSTTTRQVAVTERLRRTTNDERRTTNDERRTTKGRRDESERSLKFEVRCFEVVGAHTLTHSPPPTTHRRRTQRQPVCSVVLACLTARASFDGLVVPRKRGRTRNRSVSLSPSVSRSVCGVRTTTFYLGRSGDTHAKREWQQHDNRRTAAVHEFIDTTSTLKCSSRTSST